MSAAVDEPTIPPALRRPLAAAWISLGLHVALIALVQVAPPAATRPGETVIEARLESKRAEKPAAETPPQAPEPAAPEAPPQKAPLLAPAETAEALPVAKPVAAPVPQPVTPPAAPVPAATPVPVPAAPPSAPVPVPQMAAAPAPAAAITSSVDLSYYSARDVDVHPRALREIVPDYPADADRKRLSGKVRLQLKLEADGRVTDIDVVDARPPDVFDESAIKAFRDARFAPAQKNGRPVRALVLIEVVYDWEGRPR